MRSLIPVVFAGLTPILVIALILAGLSLHFVAWQPPVLWDKSFGTSGAENAVTTISVGTGGLYAGGYIGFTPAGNPSAYAFVARYDLNGHNVWTQQLGRSPDWIVDGILVDSTGLIVSARLNGTLIIRGYDFNATQLWTGKFGNVNPDDRVLVYGGGFYSSHPGLAYPNGTVPTILSSYSFRGNQVWNVSLGLVYPFSLFLYSGPSGVYVAASQGEGAFDNHAFVSKYAFNGTSEWTRQFDTSSFACSCYPAGVSGDTSGLYVPGRTNSNFPGQSVGDLFLRKYDYDGNVLWTDQFYPLGLSYGGVSSISASPSGIYATGTTAGIPPGYTLKFDGNGHLIWSLARDDSPDAVSASIDGVYLGGLRKASGSGGLLAFVQELAPSSSLVLFGVNPPFSFGIAALLGGLVGVSVFFLRRRMKRRPPRPAPDPWATLPKRTRG